MKRKVVVPIGVSVLPVDWDYKKQLVKAKAEKAEELNMVINKARGLANQILINYKLKNIDLSPSQFKQEFRNPAIYVDFLQWMESEIQERTGSVLTPKTARNHMTVLKELKRLNSSITFADIDSEFIDGIVKHIKKKYQNINSQEKKLKIIKTYVNIARRREIITKDPFLNVKIKKGKSNPVFLEEDELRSLCELYNTELLNPRDKKILRHFLFGCFTGLRISDIRSLTYEHIIGGMIVKHPEKSRRVNMELVKIPLSKSALKLMKDENPLRIAGPVFMTHCEQVMNRQLKHIAHLARINKRLTTHIARHTFATTYLRKRPGDIATLQKLLGHSKIEQTLIYVHISDEWKREQMKVFDDYI